jgi:DNA topoisomerase-1
MKVNYCDIKKLEASNEASKWWEKEVGTTKSGDKSDTKWKTLKHNGVLFPPPYEPLPEGITVLYKGKPVTLDSKNLNNPYNVSAEEAMVFYATQLERDERLSAKSKTRKKNVDKTFTNNFWNNWNIILKKTNSVIKNIKDVDFSPVIKYISKTSISKTESKKSLSKEDKEEDKKYKEENKDIYGYAIVDGVKILMGSYLVQPPGLFLGRGEQPLRGSIKARLKPEDITLNISKDSVPRCKIHNRDCKWGEIVENHDVTWIATWKNPVTNDKTYVWLKREESTWACQDDYLKFNKARKLKEKISEVRSKYMKDLVSKKKDIRQLATAVYLLDVLAIRPGTEKDEKKEADTQGLTTLKCENIKFKEDNTILISFIGKDSIKFKQEFKVEPIVYGNLKELCKGKDDSDKLFPSISATSLNDYLKTMIPDLTSKVFRTFKASSILEKELNKNIPDEDLPEHEKKILYDKVNMEVAKALNHKKLGGSDDRVVTLKKKISDLKAKKKASKTEKQKATVQKSIDKEKMKLEEAEQNISIGTSKLNYMDPRITVSWCKKAGMPIEKIYSKVQLAKFDWSMETGLTWKF